MRALALALGGFLFATAAQAAIINVGAEIGPEVCGKTCTVSWSGGGYVMSFVRAADRIEREDRKVVLDGDCYSSCTLMVDLLVPKGRVCITPKARFFIHQTTTEFAAGGMSVKVHGDMPYRDPLRAYVAMRGGQPITGFLEIGFEDLKRFVPVCGERTASK